MVTSKTVKVEISKEVGNLTFSGNLSYDNNGELYDGMLYLHESVEESSIIMASMAVQKVAPMNIGGIPTNGYIEPLYSEVKVLKRVQEYKEGALTPAVIAFDAIVAEVCLQVNPPVKTV